METKYYTLIEKDALKKDFLYIPKKFIKYKNRKDIFWIYKIENLLDGRIYVGKTSNIDRRALNYINAYLKGDISRKITAAFQKNEFFNFTMKPIEIAFNEKSAEIKEKYYIDLYNSIDNGYNVYNNSSPTYKNRKRPSVPHTLYSKMIKSKLIAAINTYDKVIVFSTGLKLFGDYIHRSKDEIKSAAKRETRLSGFFIYYMNLSDFSKQIMDAESKIKKNSTYEDYRLQYHDFIKYSEYLKNLLIGTNNPENFDIKFITQSNDECGYKFEKLEKFFDYYNNASNRIV